MTTLQKAAPQTPGRLTPLPRGGKGLRPHVISAIFRRDFLGYFSNLAGYVFIALFVLVCSWAEFCLPAFFANNLANLAPLNEWMPYLLLFFIPAITMGIWADERRQGTDELLLTLPARDIEVVLGKYLAALGIYTVALLFLLPHAIVLLSLGRPDLSVLASTFVGYWLMGAMLIAVGMVASLLSPNATVAFILGGLLSAAAIFLGQAGALIAARLARVPGVGSADAIRQMFEDQSLPARFRDFSSGVLTVSGVVYFLSWAAGLLYLNMVLLSRRQWAGGTASQGRITHALARIAAVAVGLISLNVLVGYASSARDFLTVVLLLGGLAAGLVLFVLQMTVFAPAAASADAGSPVPVLLRNLGLGLGLGLLACFVMGRGGLRLDASQERLSSLSRESLDLIDKIDPSHPVYIQAYLSPQVPRDYVDTKDHLINLLREVAARGGSRIRLNLVDTERFSPEARDAEKRFGIGPRRVPTQEEGRQSSAEVFLGVAFTSGAEEVVVPFFDIGLPVEYELTRSIRVVSKGKRKKVGILNTDAKLLGGFDMASMGRDQEWAVVTELKKQYDVSNIAAESDIPGDLDALVVAQPSSLPQKPIDNLTAFVRKGGPTLLLLDPAPVVDLSIAPDEPRMPAGGMFGGTPPPEPKGNLKPLLELLNLDWPTDQIVWGPDNPTKLTELPREFVFVRPTDDVPDAFNRKEPATSGLQKLVFLFPGFLQERGARTPRFTPLVQTGDLGGTIAFNEVVQRNPMGMGMGLNPRRAHLPALKSYVLAARIDGPFVADPAADPKAPAPRAATGEAKVIAIADLDLMSETFFSLRRQKIEDLDFDNVSFVLNCIDELTGDDAFLGLRKKRPTHRTLTAFDEQARKFEADRQREEKAAEDAAREELDKAQKDLDAKVKVVEARKDLDDRTKEIMLSNLQEVENRRLTNVIKVDVEDRKRRKIEEAETEAVGKRRKLQADTQFVALALPPLLPLALGLIVATVRSRRENRGAGANRLA